MKRSGGWMVFASVVSLLSLGSRQIVRGQDDNQENTTSSTTYDSTGVVTAISPPVTITVSSRRGPFKYQLGPDVFVYGLNHKAVGLGEVHKGQTVTVYYYQRFGSATVARLVILKPAPAHK
jgi:hypothetical protein